MGLHVCDGKQAIYHCIAWQGAGYSLGMASVLHRFCFFLGLVHSRITLRRSRSRLQPRQRVHLSYEQSRQQNAATGHRDASHGPILWPIAKLCLYSRLGRCWPRPKKPA